MYLSRIELHGFKSFADRTVLRFSDGLTAIVGPNGSGKTNIIDAIRWVLGEQKTSLLRTDGMSQVIFNGTRTRKPLGMAEVSIVIENTKRILPAEFSEVVVTRRLFRDGESQYLLNGSPCRRKDIVDLFADTGMGADAYSVIELKMVEQILEDHSDDRRHLFEEAAGIVKYKQRRKETLAKLDATRADIERILDHLTEVRRNVGSLKRQAERAERYQTLATELRSLQLERSYRKFCDYTATIKRLDEEVARLSAHAAQQTAELDRILEEQTSLGSTIETLGSQHQSVLADQQRAAAALAELDRECAVLEERISSTGSLLDSLLDEVRSRAARRDHLDEEIQRHSHMLETIQRELTDTEQNRARITSEIERTIAALDNARKQLAEFDEPLRTLEREHERRSAHRMQLRRNVEILRRRAAALTERLADAQRQRTALENHHRDQAEEYERARIEQSDHERALTHARARRQQLERDIEQLRQRRQALADELSQLRAEYALVSSIAERTQIDTTSKDFPLQNPPTLGDIITTDETWAVALESALGGAQHWLIVSSLQDVRAVSAWLHATGHPKVHIVCTELILPVPEPQHLPASSGARWLSSLVRCEEPIASLVRALLEGVAVCDTLDTASRLLEQYPAIRAVVSTDGQMRLRQGIMRIGSPQRTEGLSIGRRERLATIEQRIAQLEADYRTTESALTTALAERDGIALDRLEEQLRNAELAAMEIRRSLDQLGIRREQLERTIAELEAELKQIAVEQTELAAEDAALEQQLRANEAEQTDLLRRREAIAEEYRTLEQQAAALDAQLRDTERNAIRLRARLDALRETIARLGEQRNALDTDEEWSQSEHRQLHTQLATLESELATRKTERDIARKKLDELSEHRRLLEAAIAEHRSALNALHERAATIRSHIEQLRQRIHALELDRERTQTLREQLAEQVRTTYECDIATYQPAEQLPHDQLDAAIARLESQIAALGAINFSALEQYNQERQRLDELESQYRDLQSSEANLRATITEINTTAGEQFLRTFEEIRKHFKELFALLFQGDGEADLVMDGDDPLEARINIVARPRGKRPLTIEMLSGGEKTLTAIALLFAIYMVKPSPFCILDEVDAPLDDANIDRYLQLIRRFSDTTQFLLITHNKRTMEAADVLYGVTMQEPGVSKIVSVRLTDPEVVSQSDE